MLPGEGAASGVSCTLQRGTCAPRLSLMAALAPHALTSWGLLSLAHKNLTLKHQC